jgi:hypothetical protein
MLPCDSSKNEESRHSNRRIRSQRAGEHPPHGQDLLAVPAKARDPQPQGGARPVPHDGLEGREDGPLGVRDAVHQPPVRVEGREGGEGPADGQRHGGLAPRPRLPLRPPHHARSHLGVAHPLRRHREGARGDRRVRELLQRPRGAEVLDERAHAVRGGPVEHPAAVDVRGDVGKVLGDDFVG